MKPVKLKHLLLILVFAVSAFAIHQLMQPQIPQEAEECDCEQPLADTLFFYNA